MTAVTAVTAVGSLVSTALFVLAGAVVSVTVRRICFPTWRGSAAVTVVVLVGMCWALGLGQLLGAVGLLRPLPLVLAAIATALIALAVSRAVPASPVVPVVRELVQPPEPLGGDWGNLALTVGVVVLVGVVAAIWTARTVIALRRGINDPDSLGYHLPLMATFARSGYADQHRLLIPLYPVQFYPANDELLSAIALLLTRSVVFAAAKNLLFGGLVVVAAHALGSAYRAGRLAVTAAAVMLGFPVMAFLQPGEAVNDSLMLLALVGGLAVLAHARDRPAPYVLALGCAGVALGIKFSAIVPAATLGVVAVVLLLARLPMHRWRWAGVGLLTSVGLGGSWYLRNAITYGNPVPPVHVAFGPLHLRTIATFTGTSAFSVAHYLVEGRFYRQFGHGLIRALGPVGTVIAIVSLIAAAAIAVRSHDGFLRGLSVFSLVGLVGYLLTPAGAAGTAAQVPYAFVVNLHYAAPALIAAMVVAALSMARSRWAWALPVVGIVAVLTSIGPGRSISIWSPEIGGRGFALLGVAAAAGGAAALAALRPAWRRGAIPALAVAALSAVIGVVAVAGRYPSRRSTDPVAGWAGRVPATTVAAWIANIGDLYGPHAQNRVEVLARVDGGAAVPIDTCQGWKQAVVAGHFHYTAVIAGTAWARWLNADPAFQVVARDVGANVYRVVGQPDLGCAGQVNSGADFWLVPTG